MHEYYVTILTATVQVLCFGQLQWTAEFERNCSFNTEGKQIVK